jgi:hypothetical protein
MKRILILTLLLCSTFLVSCVTNKPAPALELVIVEVNKNTHVAQLELRNFSGRDVEYAENDFISAPKKFENIPEINEVVFGDVKKTLKNGEVAKLSWDQVYNDFPIGVFVYHKNNVSPEIIWTETSAFSK